MEQKPTNIYILFILWIVICVIFSGMLITQVQSYLASLSFSTSPFGNSQWNTYLIYSLILFFLLYLGIIILSAILAYGTLFNKKRSWLIGIMLSSFLGYYVFLGIYTIGNMMIMGTFDNIFSNLQTGFQLISYILLIIFVPIMLFTLLRKDVRAYFGKT